MKECLVKLMPWKWHGMVLIGGVSSEFAAYAKRMCDIDITTGANAAGHAHVEYGKPFLIWLHSLSDIPALAHEALHVTHGILEERGLKYTPDAEEAFTYTMEDIIRQTLDCKKWAIVKASLTRPIK